MISAQAIVAEYEDRKRARGKVLEHMRQARDHINGDVVIPLPKVNKTQRPIVANLIQMGLDQTAMRVASVLPHLNYPALQPGKDKGVQSEDWARRRRMANAYWWEQSKMNLKLRRIARWIIGYATGSFYVEPDFDREIPRYSLRDPMNTFPDTSENWDDDAPVNVIYTYKKSFAWLAQNFPEFVRANFDKGRPHDGSMVELLHWVDADEIVLILKAIDTDYQSDVWTPGSESVPAEMSLVISRVPNRAGRCLGVVGKRITFDRLIGQFNQVFGIYQNQATLMALELLAVKKGIFPDLALVPIAPNLTPTLVGGDNRWKDGLSGQVNVIKDGKVEVVQLNPGFMTQPAADRLERYIRTAGGVPAQFGGETPTNIATGRLGDQILSATVDYPIQEYQEILSSLLQEANKAAIAVARGWFGDKEKSFYVAFNKNVGSSQYVPLKHFETDEHRVVYSAPGADVNSLVIGNGQRVGLNGMSVQTMMEQDPMIPDPEMEKRRVASERLQNAMLDRIAVSVTEGLLDPEDVVFVWEQVEKGVPVPLAFKEAQRRSQERQAEAIAAAQAQAAAGTPLPEAQPGLAGGVPPNEAGLSIRGPNPSQENLAMFLGTLRQPRSLTSPLGNPQPSRTPVG